MPSATTTATIRFRKPITSPCGPCSLPRLDWQDWKTPQQRQVSLYTAADRQRVAEIEAEAQRVEVEKQQRRDELITAELEKALLRVDDASLREPLRIAFRTAADKRSAEQNQLLATYPFVRQLSAGSLYLYNQEAANEIKEFDERIAAIRSRKGVEPFIARSSNRRATLPRPCSSSGEIMSSQDRRSRRPP